MNKNILLLLVGVILIGGVVYSSQKKPSTKKEEILSQSNTTATKAAMSNQVKDFSMIAKKWQFNPSTINVKQGDKVRLKIKSIDVAHGFSLLDFNVNENLEPEKEVVVEFIADKKGEFTFFCSVLCGQGHGDMKGKLVVE